MEDGESEFESGYAGTDEAAEKPLEVVEPVVEATPEPKEEPKPDPMQEILSRFDKLEQRTRNTEGHIGGLNHNLKQVTETLAASKAAAQHVSDAPTQTQVKEAMANPKEWDALKGDFPEWANATEKLMESKLSQVGNQGNVDAVRREVESIRGETAAVRKEIAESALDAAFPGWMDDINTPEFGTWMQTQPEEIKALAASSKVRDASRMLRLFEAHKSKKATPTPSVVARQKRIEAAVTPRGTGGFTPANSELDEFEAGYNSL